MFTYHWTSVVYDLSVVAPALLLCQSLPLQANSTESLPVTLPPDFLFHLLKLTSLLHPLTHSRVLEMWNDVTDLKSDRLLTSEDITHLLSQVKVYI